MSTKACPFCGELIVASAIKCRFCGEALDPEQYTQARRELEGARVRRPSTKPYPPLAPHLQELETSPESPASIAAAAETAIGNDTARQWAIPPGDELAGEPAATAPAQTPPGDELAQELAVSAPAQTPLGNEPARAPAAREPLETLDFPSIDELPAEALVVPRRVETSPRPWYTRPPALAGAAVLLLLAGVAAAYLLRTPGRTRSPVSPLEPDARPRPTPTAGPLVEPARPDLASRDTRRTAARSPRPATAPVLASKSQQQEKKPSATEGGGGDADSELDFPSPYGEARETKPAAKQKKPRDEVSDEDVLFDPYGGEEKAANKSSKERPALTAEQVAQGMAKIRVRVQRCANEDGGAGVIKLKVVIAPSGAVTAVTLHDPATSTPAAECVRAAVKLAKFPAFAGRPVTVVHPFKLP